MCSCVQWGLSENTGLTISERPPGDWSTMGGLPIPWTNITWANITWTRLSWTRFRWTRPTLGQGHHMPKVHTDQIQMAKTYRWTRPSHGQGHHMDTIQIDQTHRWTRASHGQGHHLLKPTHGIKLSNLGQLAVQCLTELLKELHCTVQTSPDWIYWNLPPPPPPKKKEIQKNNLMCRKVGYGVGQ